MRILTILPTIHRDKFEKMYNSFQVTASKYNTLLIINKVGCITELLNEAFEKHNDYDYYHVSNDDVVYETPLWDITIAQKGKICHGKDNIPNGHTGNFLMIDGDIARSVGWIQMPTLNRYCGDIVWKFIGQQLGILQYYPEVLIQHKWEGADIKTNQEDVAKFSEWLSVCHRDLDKIRKVL